MVSRLVKRIRIDGMTYYWRNGKVYACPSKRPHCSGKNWKKTPKREKNKGDFSGNRYHGSHVKDVYAGLPVWKHAYALGGEPGQTYDNYRHSVNSGCVDKDGNVFDFRHFTVSIGKLWMPVEMTLERAGDEFTFRWEDKRDIPLARPGDVLHVFFITASMPSALRRVSSLSAVRAGGEASFFLPGVGKELCHFYPFFANAANNGFSKNDYFISPATPAARKAREVHKVEPTTPEIHEVYKVESAAPATREVYKVKPVTPVTREVYKVKPAAPRGALY